MKFELVQSGAAAASAAAGGAAAIATDGLSIGILGVPISVLLAAFTAAAGVLAFLPAMPVGRAIVTVLFCTQGGAYAGVAASANVAMLAGTERFSAFVAAVLLQVFIPLAIERRAAIFESACKILRKRHGGNS